ncbi:MAG: threonine/serine dehydratase [Hyphomicrobiaceae bacterium]
MTADLPSFDDVLAARRRLAGHAVRTPVIRHPALDAAVGGRVLIKSETLQRVGAFKFRGAFNRISMVDPARFPGGVVACSSGNHAQGVAHAAALLGHASAIVMPSDAPRLKIARTRGYGADVVLYDRTTQDREEIARALAQERKADFVHPFDDTGVIAGQGTAGLELAEDAAAADMELDAVVVPCSGGGLASGVAIAVKQLMPGARIIIVEPEGFDDFARSLKSGERETNERAAGSIADALMALAPGRLTLSIGLRLFDGAVTVTDEEMRQAMRFAFAELKLIVEPGGAAALAALLSGRIAASARTVGVLLTGGNVDAETFAQIVAAAPETTAG